jgi:predicted DNA-binding transcriptional regulator AlpA
MNSEKQLLTAKQICNRFGGISEMALWRWLQDPNLAFPKPFMINSRRYWVEAEIDAWLEARREAA